MSALGNLFSDIAGAIREKTGETGTMKPAQFPEKILGIETVSSSSDSLTYKSGSFEGNGGKLTINHNMGFIPDMILVFLQALSTNKAAIIYAIGYSSPMLEALGGGYLCPSVGSNTSISLDYGFEGASSKGNTYGNVREVTATSFTVGGTTNILQDGEYYNWIAIGGIL